MKPLRRLLLAAAAWLSAAGAFAGEGAGTASGVFLTLPADAVTAALGGAAAAAQPSPAAVFGNPAGLGGVESVGVEFSHALWLEGISYNTLAAAVPAVGGTAALGLRYLSYGGIDALDNTGATAGSMSPRDMAASAAWAGELGGGWAAGAGGKYVDSRIAASASTFALDAGLRYSAGRLAAGVSVENLGGELKFGRESYPLPLLFRLGGSYEAPSGLRLLLDGDIPGAGPGWVSSGLEYPYVIHGARLALRGGYSTRYIAAGGLNGLSAGVGVKVRDFEFNYAFTAVGDLGVAHQFGIGLRWGGAAAGEKAEGPTMFMFAPI
jgi:hypothetical protein